MSVTIRNAGAEDVPFLATVMLMASRSQLPHGLWDQFVHGNEEQCLSFLQKLAVTKVPHLFHYTVFIIAEKDGRAVAGLSGYDPETEGMPFFARALPTVTDELGWSRTDLKAASQRMSSYIRCAPDDPPGVWIVESVAVLPHARGQGLISLLLEEILRRGKAKGCEKARIGVFAGNTSAMRAYEKAGFRFVDEKRDDEFQKSYGDYGIVRMMMDLR